MWTRRATVRRVTEQPVLDAPQEWEIRDELQRLVLADLHGPLDGQAVELRATARWARYEFAPSEREETLGKRVWRRVQQGGTVRLRLAEGFLDPQAPDPDQPDVVVRGRKHNGNWLVSLFLENRQSELDRRRHAPSWIFQVQLSGTGTDDQAVFLPRPERPNGGDHDDAAEQQRLAMAYRFHPEFAVGSGVAVHADVARDDPLRAKEIHTRTVPDYEIPATDVPSVDTDPDLTELADLELDMERLAELAETSADSLVTVRRPLVAGYRAWIKRKTADIDEPRECLADYADQARDNLDAAARAADRIEAGIDLVAGDDVARRLASARCGRVGRIHVRTVSRWDRRR